MKHALKGALGRLVLPVERLIDRLFAGRREGKAIDPYIGYSTPDGLILRGRVLSKLERSSPQENQRKWTNFRQMLQLFITREVAQVEVTSGEVRGRSDEEGYFTLKLERPTESGWQELPVRLAGVAEAVSCKALVVRVDAQFLVISDIDDTVLQTGAYVLWRNLWTSLTGNSLTRTVFPDAIDLMQRLSDEGRNPIFYVSSSPWNFHHFLEQVFARTGLVLGPLFLRDLGVSESQFITGTHGDHKGGSIDTILAAVPDIPVILMGDTGQHDAQVYRDAIARHPDRIKAVVLREPGPGPKPEAKAAMEQIKASGTPLLHAPSFKGMAPEKELP